MRITKTQIPQKWQTRTRLRSNKKEEKIVYDYKINGILGVSGSVLATLPGALTPDGIVQLVSIICSVAIALTTVGLQIYTAIKKRNNGGAEYLKGLDVKSLDQLLKELREREKAQAKETANLAEEADENEYAPVTLPGEEE